MKKKICFNWFYVFVVAIIPIIYVIYNTYLMLSINSGKFSGIYTDLQGMALLFVYYSATLMGNYSLSKEKKKTTLAVFLLIQFICILYYLINIYIELNLLALFDVIVLAMPFVSGMVQLMLLEKKN